MLLTPAALLTTAVVASIGAVSGYVAIKGHKEAMSKVDEVDLLPMSPENGPPLPRILGVRWPGRK